MSGAAPLLTTGPSLVKVCGWCQSVISLEPVGPAERTALTHGMCPSCAQKQLAQLEQLRAVKAAAAAAVDRKVCLLCGGYFNGLKTVHVCGGCESEVAA